VDRKVHSFSICDRALAVSGHFNLTAIAFLQTLENIQMKTASLVLLSLCLSLRAFAAEVPPESELKSMTLSSLLAFNDGVQEKDFSDFYKELSALWQDQTTPEKLKELFNDFIEKEINIAPIKKLQPVFNKDATINSDGMLVIAGYYPTVPKRVVFELKYLKEKGDWRLAGINVKTLD
jgi:hypothetical protein